MTKLSNSAIRAHRTELFADLWLRQPGSLQRSSSQGPMLLPSLGLVKHPGSLMRDGTAQFYDGYSTNTNVRHLTRNSV